MLTAGTEAPVLSVTIPVIWALVDCWAIARGTSAIGQNKTKDQCRLMLEVSKASHRTASFS